MAKTDREEKRELRRKALIAWNDIYEEGSISWAFENGYGDEITELMIKGDDPRLSRDELHETLAAWYVLFRDRINPAYGEHLKDQKEKVKEAFQGKEMA